MSKTKYTVTHAGQTFTRSTNRVYTHLVLAKPNPAGCLANALKRARNHLQDWDFIRLKAASPTLPEYTSEETWAEYKRRVAMGKDAWLAELIQKVHAQHQTDLDNGVFDRYQVMGWCGRPDLADKEARRILQHPDGWWREVVVLEVPQP